MTYLAGHGLTSQQAWGLARITRCDQCGSWQMLTHLETLLRATPGYTPPVVCSHLEPKSAMTRKAVA